MEQNWQSVFKQPQQDSEGAVSQKAALQIKFSKIDTVASISLGLIIGVFAPLILQNIGKSLPFQNYYFAAFPVLTLIGVWISYLIGSRLPVIIQIAKFGVVGVANTVIDFGVLNYLSAVQHVFSGLALVPLNIISFTVAVINSYFWNKHWTFKTKEGKAGRQFVEFIIVSVIAIFINSGAVYLITLIPPVGVSEQVWLNISKLIATFLSLVWNFVGYKFVVFKD